MAQKRNLNKDPFESVSIGQATYYRGDCISGAKQFLGDNSIDLVVTDPPYGINGDLLHQHYNRDERFVVGQYIEVAESKYGDFSLAWIKELERVLKPGGAAYIISGYTNLYHILSALRQTSLREVNHIIWRYNFGVFTRSKFVSSHYHILYYQKPGGKRTFNLEARYGLGEADPSGALLNYSDREDVWRINREYRPQREKNKNSLPTELLVKILQYSSSEGDVVCDFFMGGFTTARVAVGLNRLFIGFELSKRVFSHHVKEAENFGVGSLLGKQRVPNLLNRPPNQWKAWSAKEVRDLKRTFRRLKSSGVQKQRITAELMRQFGRGKWSIEHMLKRHGLRYKP